MTISAIFPGPFLCLVGFLGTVQKLCSAAKIRCIPGPSLIPRSKSNSRVIFSLQYFHNGEDKLEDQMTLVASTGTKTSMPAVLTIRVLPVNDEMPLLVNNTGLEVWAGATTPITNRHLGKNCILKAAASSLFYDPQTRSFVLESHSKRPQNLSLLCNTAENLLYFIVGIYPKLISIFVF